MGKFILSVVVAFAFTATANANVSAPAWVCAVDADNASGENVGLGFSGGTLRSGNATVSCLNIITGKKTVKQGAIVITFLGAGLGYTKFESISIRSVIAGLAKQEQLYSTRWGAKAGINFIAAEGGVMTSIGNLSNGVNVEVALYGANAKGLALNVQGMKLQVMNKATYANYMKKVAKRKQAN